MFKWTRRIVGNRGAGIELAKYLEHEARDLPAAKEVTRAVLASCPKAERLEVEHRLARIRRKLQGCKIREGKVRKGRSGTENLRETLPSE